MNNDDWTLYAKLKGSERCIYYEKGDCTDPVNFEYVDKSPVQCGGCSKAEKPEFWRKKQ